MPRGAISVPASNGDDMPTIADAGWLVTGGAGTHAGVPVAGMAGQAGRVLGTREFAATAKGYAAALTWLRGHGELARAGVEAPGATGPGWPATWPPAAPR